MLLKSANTLMRATANYAYKGISNPVDRAQYKEHMFICLEILNKHSADLRLARSLIKDAQKYNTNNIQPAPWYSSARPKMYADMAYKHALYTIKSILLRFDKTEENDSILYDMVDSNVSEFKDVFDE